MPKRSAEPSIEFHTINDMTLRVRLADYNIEGSAILILKDGTRMECVKYQEVYAIEYTEADWIQRYHAIYDGSLDPTPDDELLESNENAKLFNDKAVSTVKLSNSELAGRDHCKEIQIEFEFVSWENDVLKMKAKRAVTMTSKHSIAHIQHTSMVLTFMAL